MDKIIDFVSINYIWFIVAGSILLIVSLILLLTKKEPVKEEVVEAKDNKEEIVEEIIEEPVIDTVEEPSIDSAPVSVNESSVNNNSVNESSVTDASFDSIVNATPVSEDTETLDIIEDSSVVEEMPIGEVEFQSEDLNVDSVNTSEDDIWKF